MTPSTAATATITCLGEDGNDDLFGGVGNDVLVGGRGNDALKGDEADDRLTGEFGTDALYGGDGADVFAAEGTGSVVVKDFKSAVDHVDMSKSIVPSRIFGHSGTISYTAGGGTVVTDTYLAFGAALDDQMTILDYDI